MIFSNLALLQKTRFRLAINSATRAGRRGLFKYVAVFVMASLFVVGDYLFFHRILAYFNELPLDVGEILIVQILNLLCLTIFSMLVFSNIVAAISTLYMSRDLDFIISSPIPIRAVFLSKFILTTYNSSWMPLLFSLPVFVAYGNVFYAGWGYYAILPFLILPFLLIPAGIGIMTTMTLARFFPARKAYQVMSFIGVIFLAGLVLYLRFMQPEKFIGKDVADSKIIEFVEKLKAPDYEWLPSSMMTNALKAGVTGDWPAFNTEFLWLWMIALVCVVITTLVAGAIYYTGWASSQTAKKAGSADKERFFYWLVRRVTGVAGPDIRAFFLKDSKLFFRDTAQWSQLFMLGALVVVYIFNIRNLPLDTIYLKNLISVMNIGLAGVVLSAVAARFVFASTSMEGRSFWAIKTAPVDFGRFLWAKFFMYFFPLLILAETLVIASNLLLGIDGYVMAVSAGTIAAITTGITGLGVGLGAIYPKFDFENVAEVATTSGAITYMIISMAYIGLCVSLVAGPVYVHLSNTLLLSGLPESDAWFYFGVLTLVTAIMAFLPLKIGARSLEKFEI